MFVLFYHNMGTRIAIDVYASADTGIRCLSIYAVTIVAPNGATGR